MTPEVKNLPQWTWTLIAESVSVITINNLSPGFKVWYTTRDTGTTAPATPTETTVPVEAVDLYPRNETEAVLESQTLMDVYAFVYSKDVRTTSDGNLLLRPGIGNSIDVDTKYGGMNVNILDKTTPPVIAPFAEELGSTTLASDAVKDSYTITVTSAAAATVGDHVRIIDVVNDRFFIGQVLVITGTVITLDRPLDFAYASGSQVIWANINMAVNGSVTPVVFKLRLGTPSVSFETDITRIMITCMCSTAVDLSAFGNIANGLTRGLVLRKVNAVTNNIFNVKRNADIAALAYDWTPYTATNPAQGLDGFTTRLTFAGQNKLGVALRVGPDGNLEVVVQDDLTSLVYLTVIGEGHVVS